MSKGESKLPDRLSDLLDLAVADARAFEATEGCRLNMATWLEFPSASYGGSVTCVACLAGAVMRRTLGLTSEREAERELDSPDGRKLLAINCLRQGNVYQALRRLANLHAGEDLEVAPEVWELSGRYGLEYQGVLRSTLHLPWERYAALAAELRGLGL